MNSVISCYYDAAVQGARATKGQYRGPWSLGYSPLIDLRILSKVRGHLSSAHPAADVRLISAHTSEQADGLVRGTLQAGLVILPIREQEVTYEGLYRETLVESAWYPYGRSQKPED